MSTVRTGWVRGGRGSRMLPRLRVDRTGAGCSTWGRPVLIVSALIVTALIVTVLSWSGPVKASAEAAAQSPTPSSPTPAGASGEGRSTAGKGSPIPLFAYYYLWFDPTSWDRAKIDSPQLGRYSSDDPAVIRQHIRWAVSAGIGGFILSWKDTPTYARRLRLLMNIANEEHFSLAVIYEGMDFNRNPLAVEGIARDLRTFADNYAADPVFYRVGGRPLLIWSGTWMFSHDQVATVTGGVRGHLTVLASAKSVEDYQRTADVTDGNAYYWSSINPATNRDFGDKLSAMSRAVHARGQFWIAPFAPGFDARLVGGRMVVDRSAGATMRTEYAAALASSPDMFGLISWNEWSENTYVEPSHTYGFTELQVLRGLREVHTPLSSVGDDSSGPSGTSGTPGEPSGLMLPSSWPNLLLLSAFLLLLLLGGAWSRLRMRHRERTVSPPTATPDTDPESLSSSADHSRIG
jgi:hypothetical protein